MKRENTAIRLKKIMDERGLRQIDILNLAAPYCEKYNVKMNKSDISQYCSGKTEPMQDKLFILSAALDVNEAWLMGYDVGREKRREISNVYPITLRRLPMLGEIACGEPRYANEDRESYVLAGTDIKADFCLKAKGDSMVNARIQDGDIVFIRQQDVVENGEIAAVVVNGDDEATLKRFYYYRDKSLLILKAENPKYADQVYQNEELDRVHVLGKAVAFQGDVI